MKNLLFLFLLCLAISSCNNNDDGDMKRTVKDIDYIRINSIDLNEFPATNPSGTAWDAFSQPDPYIKIFRGNEVIYTTNVRNSISPTSGTSYSTSGLLLDHPEEIYDFVVYDDDDPLVDELIGSMGAIFGLVAENNDFPPTLTFPSSTGVEIVLNVEYVYK